MFRTAGKPRVAQPPQRDNVVAAPISSLRPAGARARERNGDVGAHSVRPAGGWQPPLRRIWSMVPGGRRDIRLLTSVWRRRLGNVFSCAPGSRRAFLRRWHMRPVQCPRERRAAGSRPYEGQRRLCRPPFTGSAARGCVFAAASGGGKREDRRTEKTSWARPGRPPQKIHNNTVEKNGPIW